MEAIGQLAGGVAHDFNNILTVIQGSASLLLNPQLDPEEKLGCSRQIVQAAERAAGLTRQLLMFSRKHVLQMGQLDLNEVVGNMTKMLQRILGEDITLRAEYDPKLPVIAADAGMIEQVLLNLAVNSRDAMPTGGRLLISTSVENLGTDHPQLPAGTSPGSYVCLKVSDTGSGIPPDVLPRIFEPFFTTKETGKGTGLGLATVYGIIQQHHGWVTVTSEVGRGTTFHVHLPAAKGAPTKLEASTAAPKLPRGHETILLVEDEPAVRSLVGNLLQRCGYTILGAESGVVALRVWKEHRDKIQLLLTDMIMPDGMTGYDLAQRLKSEQPQLKVIYTSGYSADIFGKDPTLIRDGCFLQKPYHPHQLARTVRDCLDQQPGNG
jgi:CheY-like chemotaxis protein